MAEITASGKANGHSGKKRKRLSTNVDLTPMVDLGFLLITFFIFTTSMSEPKSMKLALPADKAKDSSVTAEGKTLNLIIYKNNTVLYYMGTALNNIRSADFSPMGIRKIINEKRTQVGLHYGNPKELVVLIKPSAVASYQNVLNILDEMLINDVSRYVLMDPTSTELSVIQ
jgi:biopolymer transport protein ExbD